VINARFVVKRLRRKSLDRRRCRWRAGCIDDRLRSGWRRTTVIVRVSDRPTVVIGFHTGRLVMTVP
jgi:hypothetical protein